MVPDAYDELIAERSGSATQAAGSIRAEGQSPSVEATSIAESWARGEITTAQMRYMIRALHTAP